MDIKQNGERFILDVSQEEMCNLFEAIQCVVSEYGDSEQTRQLEEFRIHLRAFLPDDLKYRMCGIETSEWHDEYRKAHNLECW